MAASSASAPRSASPPTACMPAGRWAQSSSQPTNMWSAGPARRVPDGGRPAALRPGFHLAPGMRVGLYGGSFNPAHEGHAHVAETAKRRLRLDRVIWLVSPQNPLKAGHETADLGERMAGARALAKGPGMIVSDVETQLGSA